MPTKIYIATIKIDRKIFLHSLDLAVILNEFVIFLNEGIPFLALDMLDIKEKLLNSITIAVVIQVAIGHFE